MLVSRGENMSPSKKSKAKLKAITLSLPWMSLEWESDERELKALRDLLNQLRSRRAFEINRGIMSEQPVFFLDSIVQMRTETRRLLDKLPIGANESRILMLTVMDWLGEILDEWSHTMSRVRPNAWDFRRLDMSDIMTVMKHSWNTVENVRKRLDKLAIELERQLGFKGRH
jgi:hypothetical protein